MYSNGTDERLYIVGDVLSTGAVSDDVSSGKIYYGTTINTNITAGKFIVFTNSNQINQIFKVATIGSEILNSGDDATHYFTVTAVTTGAVAASVLKLDTFDICDRPADLQGTSIALADGENIKISGITADYDGFYRLASSSSIYNDGTDDIYIKLDTTFKALGTIVLADLDFTDAQVYTEPQYQFRLYFYTEDEDMFMNSQQIVVIEPNELYTEDFVVTTEKV
jgi:hypothetical protein